MSGATVVRWASRVLLMTLAATITTAQADGEMRDMYQTPGVIDKLPVFHGDVAGRLAFPLSWTSGRRDDFGAWRTAARNQAMACLLAPPLAAPYDPVAVAEEDRGSYVARKVVLNITGDSRVLSYMLVPKGEGPFPAVLLLHDHGARFDIGKEKVVRPWDVPTNA